ncbi:MAG: glycosyltransferase [Ruminococcaceae bacterium]|nr:glycosyltransferase [Oscillospiraceae bacterium]
MDLVTCAITTHKRIPEIVERALKSILNQTYKNIEVFVVDDSPSDWEHRKDVQLMVESYALQNVTYIPHEKCMGACVARNTALEKSNGKYIGFLDDDDEWKPTKIEKMIKAFTNDDIALVYCNSEVIDEITGKKTLHNPKVFTGKVFDTLIFENYIGSTSFPVLRTSYLKEIGGFDPLMQSGQDYDVWLRLAEKYDVGYVDEPLCTYYFHEGEQITKNPLKKVNGLERIIEKNMAYLSNHSSVYSVRLFGLLPYSIKAKQYKKSFGLWFKATIKSPLKLKTSLYYMWIMVKTLLVELKNMKKSKMEEKQ